MARDMTLMLRVAADVKAARTSLDDLTNKARGLGVASQKAASGTDHLGASLQRIWHYGAAAFGTVQIKQFVFSLREAQLEATRIGNTLKFALGGESQGVAGMRYVADLANKLGLELRATAQGYAKFAAAASSANLTLSQTNAIFEGVAKATTVLGLSGADAGGVFLALSQMLSKGKVSAEELRGQLGERLPGALAIAARAQGVTTEKFSEMLDKGQIIARDFLPRFAAEMEKTFGAASGSAAQSAIANVNRLANAWDLFKQKFGTASDAAGITAPNWLTRALNEANAAMDKALAKGNALLAIFGALGGFGAGALGQGVLSEQSRQERIIALQERRFELEKRIQEIAKKSGSQDVKRGGEAALRSNIAAINRELEALWKHGKIKLPSKDELEAARLATLDSAKRKAPPADAEKKKATDPLASLLSQTDTARLKEYADTLALLVARQQAGKLSAEQYAEAVGVLAQKTFGRDIAAAEADEKARLAEINDFLIRQQDDINELWRDAARAAEAQQAALDALLSDTTLAKTETLRANIALLDDAFFAGKIGVEQYEQALAKLLGGNAEKLREQKSLAEELGMTFTSAFEDAIVSGKKFSDVLNSIAQDITRLFLRKTVTEPIAVALSGAFKGFDLGKVFGGARAAGGPVNSGRAYLVGERGPELFMPGVSGNIVPNHALNATGSRAVVIHMHVQANDAGSFRRSMGQIKADLAFAVGSAQRNL